MLNDLHGGNDGCMAEIENLMSGWGQPSRTTLYGILHLLAGCRAVWEYRLTSRRRLYPFVEDHVNKRTTYLNIGDSYFVSDARARFAHNSMFAQPPAHMADVGGFSEDVPRVEWDWGRLVYTIPFRK